MGFEKSPDDFGGIKIPEWVIFSQGFREVPARPDMAPILDQVERYLRVFSAMGPGFQMDTSTI